MSDEKVLTTYEELRDYITHDIQKAIEGEANYLAALGIFSCIEFLGGLLSGNGGLPREAENNFKTAVQYLSVVAPEYAVMDQRLVVEDAQGKKQKGLYAILRCGLVHEYGIKGRGAVNNKPQGPIADHTGILIETIKGKDVVVLSNNEFFRDFRTLLDNIHIKLKHREQPLLDNVRQSLTRFDTSVLVSS